LGTEKKSEVKVKKVPGTEKVHVGLQEGSADRRRTVEDIGPFREPRIKSGRSSGQGTGRKAEGKSGSDDVA
jgi:hypothetical protein